MVLGERTGFGGFGELAHYREHSGQLVRQRGGVFGGDRLRVGPWVGIKELVCAAEDSVGVAGKVVQRAVASAVVGDNLMLVGADGGAEDEQQHVGVAAFEKSFGLVGKALITGQTGRIDHGDVM